MTADARPRPVMGKEVGALPSDRATAAETAGSALRDGIPSAWEPKHCDYYIDDPAQPECLRQFLDHARAPAGSRRDPRPRLFATYQGKRVRVVTASRFGDVGITSSLQAEHGYDRRVTVDELSNFSADAKLIPAQAIEARQGQDAQRLDRNDESAVAESHAPGDPR